MARETAIAKTHQPQSLVQSDRKQPVIPACDVYENKEEILLIADVPGATPDLLGIHLEKGELSLEARRDDADCDFRRRFVVPTGIDSEKISAKLKNGVLELHLPKSEAIKPREITVRAG
jgi:HSP20 family protein